MEQLTLFESKSDSGQPCTTGTQGKTLQDYAFLYTATATGRNSGIHFMMTREDAITWCSASCSHGVFCGAPWAYFWTSVENYCNCHWGQLHGVTLDLRKSYDNGRYDEKITKMGLRKFGKAEIRRILASFGILVKV